jgi:hypothetical protein
VLHHGFSAASIADIHAVLDPRGCMIAGIRIDLQRPDPCFNVEMQVEIEHRRFPWSHGHSA